MVLISKPKLKSNIATPNKNDGKLKSAALIKVDSDGKINATIPHSFTSFELNPASYEETKSSNWASHDVPGQSNPIMQWVSGGPRTVTFEALVTKDSLHFGIKDSSFGDSLKDAAVRALGEIASKFAGVGGGASLVTDLFDKENAGSGLQLSIVNKLQYYRSLLYPTYSVDASSIESSPPLVVLAVGGTFSNKEVAKGEKVSFAKPRARYLPVWAVTNLNIRITKQLPNLDPMEAFVTFTLQEYPIKPISAGSIY